MGIQMPEMDGMVATCEIRSISGLENIPIVAMAAHAMSGDRQMCLEVGINDHISKPIDVHDMFSILPKWLKQNQ